MKMCGTGAGFGRRSALVVMMMSLAAAGCGGGGGGGTTANNTSGTAGQSAAPAPVSPFTPPAATPPATPAPTPTPPEAPPPVTAPPAVTPPVEAPAASSGGVTLAWEVPTQTSTGAPLGTLAGYHIHYGNAAGVLSETIIVDNPGVLSYVVDTLPAGTYYFAVRAVTADGDKSALSNVISKVIG